ncbi:hypothetical protein P7K49_015117 [Saguinus oedipus]|uniref:Integrator complex subunit 11 n=1 Tax=Saguinus oedipus TaxID=9490 RepID=A0ABQ9V8C1_SAGOE|nr:hypothetical protein P7K49_015117 [Saguinus oedipus]
MLPGDHGHNLTPSCPSQRRFPDFSYITQNGRLTDFLDCVIISHFHLDHCGALPYFSEMVGYDGPIYMTHPTQAICPILLEDYRKIAVDKKGEANFFTSQMIKDCMKKVVAVHLHQTVQGHRQHSRCPPHTNRAFRVLCTALGKLGPHSCAQHHGDTRRGHPASMRVPDQTGCWPQESARRVGVRPGLCLRGIQEARVGTRSTQSCQSRWSSWGVTGREAGTGREVGQPEGRPVLGVGQGGSEVGK